MRTKEELIGYFVETKGRNKEIIQLAEKLGFKGAHVLNETAKYYQFSTFFYDEGSIEFTDNVEWVKRNYKEITVEELLKEEMKQYTVNEEFIKEAHKAACSTWRTKLEEQFPEVFPKITYSHGDKLSRGGTSKYIIASVGDNKCILINTDSGDRCGRVFDVKDIKAITIKEINDSLYGDISEFKLITK